MYHSKIVLRIETGEVLERESVSYDGPWALLKGGLETKQGMTQDELSRILPIRSQFLNQENQMFGQLMPQFEQLVSGGGYSPSEQAAITGATEGGLGASYDASRMGAENRAARTRNASALPELEDEMARSRGRTSAEMGQKNQIAFADEAQKRKMAGLAGEQGLYGVNTELLQNLLGLPQRIIGGYPVPGQSGTAGSAIGAGGAIGAAAIAAF